MRNRHIGIHKIRLTGWIRCCCCLLVMAFLSFAAAGPQTERLEKDGIAIEYPPEWKAVAEEIQPWLSERLAELGVGSREDMFRLRERQENILAFVSQQLALKEPGEAMKNMWGQALQVIDKLSASFPDLRELRLWEKNELIRYLDGGGDLPGYEYDRETDRFQFAVFAEYKESQNKTPSQSVPAVPILLTKETDEERVEQAKEKINAISGSFAELAATLVPSLAIMPTTEASILGDLRVRVAHSGWFSHGVSNYITWAVLKRFFSESSAENMLRTFDTEPYLDMKQKVNLEDWLAFGPSLEPETEWEKRLEEARLAFATHEIMGLVQRHGEEVIPKICTEIQKATAGTPNETGSGKTKIFVEDMSTVLDIVDRITGEDFRKRLSEYSELPTDG
ncbi:MAG: hypothetical protein ABIH23_35620 [bacterium]